MESLPPEVLLAIAEHVPTSSKNDDKFTSQYNLGDLRLVNKAWSDAASPAMFATIPLWIGSKSLQNLTAISQHAAFSNYVHTIQFSTFQYEEERSIIKEKHEARVPSSDPTNSRYAKDLSTSFKYAVEQSSLYRANQAKTILSHAFRRLHNLRVFQAFGPSSWIGAKELHSAFHHPSTAVFTFDSPRSLIIALEALDEIRTQLTALLLGAQDIVQWNRKMTCPRRHYLNFDNSAMPSFQMLAKTLERSMPALRAWSALTYLEVHVPYRSHGQWPRPNPQHEVTVQRSLKTLFEALVNLEMFSLSGTTKGDSSIDIVTDYISSDSLLGIRSLKLGLMSFRDIAEMTTFFGRRSKHIMYVDLYYISLHDHSEHKERVYDNMRQEYDWTALKGFFLESSPGDPDADLAPFLRSETDRKPPLPLWFYKV